LVVPYLSKSSNASSRARTSSTRINADNRSDTADNGTSRGATASSGRNDPRLRSVGFRSTQKLADHYAKHGTEFGHVTVAQYLAMAQDLRDAPLSGTVIETTQKDGTLSRFDRSSGAFMAFDHDLTIRTFFKPNDGEDYFWRAAKLSH
jgi:hypothetical protein